MQIAINDSLTILSGGGLSFCSQFAYFCREHFNQHKKDNLK